MTILERFFKTVNELGPFEQNCNIAVAVSGGSDSLSLAILLDMWAKKNKAKLFAVTINHGIREESQNEAEFAKETLEKLKITHKVISLKKNTIPNSNIQEVARKYRYEMLYDFCKKNKIFHLFTGHTLNDDVENYFIRLTRGTSLNGLTGIKHKFLFNNLRVLRPLLNFSKKELQEFLMKQKMCWVEDPSNSNLKFSRVIARNILKSEDLLKLSNQDDEGILMGRVKRVISETKELYKTEQIKLYNFFIDNVAISPEGSAYINLSYLKKSPLNIFIRALSRTLTTISNSTEHEPRYDSLKKIYNKLLDNSYNTSTLAKCIIKFDRKRNIIKITKEFQKGSEKMFPFERNDDYNDLAVRFFPRSGLVESCIND